eukprot:TRINITY_DN16257_c0_g1_i1.p1 TRINITY_DN16257_c0_g1~~TRINITY_DN16257_c0_g1_i1.p1  ORF type:complete len:120 (+),score=16.91 TRINITY_DN16257_c0_g1_i1:33-362(+)
MEMSASMQEAMHRSNLDMSVAEDKRERMMNMGRKGEADGKVKKQISHRLSAFPSTEREYNILLLTFPICPFHLIEKAIVYGCLCTWPFTQRKSSTRFVLFFLFASPYLS